MHKWIKHLHCITQVSNFSLKHGCMMFASACSRAFLLELWTSDTLYWLWRKAQAFYSQNSILLLCNSFLNPKFFKILRCLPCFISPFITLWAISLTMPYSCVTSVTSIHFSDEYALWAGNWLSRTVSPFHLTVFKSFLLHLACMV